jgi:adenosylcobinamide-GDP ribazoletransferase
MALREHDDLAGDAMAGAADDRGDDDRWIEDLRRAVASLTVLRPAAATAPAEIAAAARAFPIVGFGLGVAAAAAYAVGDGLGFYGLGSAALALATVAALGGGRGEVGAAMVAERLCRGESDGRFGLYAGLVCAVFGIALRLGLLAAVSFVGSATAILVAAIAASRIAMPLAAGWGGAAGDPAAARDRRLWVVALVALLILILFLGLWGALVSAVLAAAAGAALVVPARRAGALDRPTLWAVQQAAEVAILAGAVATL